MCSCFVPNNWCSTRSFHIWGAGMLYHPQRVCSPQCQSSRGYQIDAVAPGGTAAAHMGCPLLCLPQGQLSAGATKCDDRLSLPPETFFRKEVETPHGWSGTPTARPPPLCLPTISADSHNTTASSAARQPQTVGRLELGREALVHRGAQASVGCSLVPAKEAGPALSIW